MVECLKNFVDQINIGIDQELVLPAIDLKVSQDMTSDIQQSCVYTASRVRLLTSFETMPWIKRTRSLPPALNLARKEKSKIPAAVRTARHSETGSEYHSGIIAPW